MTKDEIITKIEDSEILKLKQDLAEILQDVLKCKILSVTYRHDIGDRFDRLGDAIGDVWSITDEN